MSSYGGSIASNPRVALIDITEHGTDWIWTVFAVMLASACGMTVWAHSLGTGRRAFHYTAAALLFTASVAYFCMASDLGATPINVEFVRNTSNTYTGNVTPVTRSIWYVRYIDWVITTPLLLLTLLLGTGLPLSSIFFTVFMDEVMIVTGLVGALVASQYKWGLYVFGNFALFYVLWVLIAPARKSAYALSPEAGKAYTSSALILSFLWLLYPLAWGLADGGNVISPDSEMIFYGILDLLAKPVFTFYHMWMLSKVPYESYRLQSGHASIGAANNGLVGDSYGGYAEKNGHANGYANGHANGHANGDVNTYPPTTAAATSGPAHPNVAENFAHGTQPTHTTPGAGVVQHQTVPAATTTTA